MNEFKKYLFRFSICFVVCIPFLILAGQQALRIAIYKIAMVTVGVSLSELFWVSFFKPFFGSTEDIINAERLKAVLVFRGILYASVIMGLALGL